MSDKWLKCKDWFSLDWHQNQSKFKSIDHSARPLTDHGLYAVAHQHRQEAVVGGCAGAVDYVGQLGRPLQVHYGC